jgi:hypothetical protein
MDKFLELVKNQFCYGGKKYALSGSQTRESTDVLFDKHGKNWLFGTIDKYTFRFKNLARERDLLKIATYMYILWLKRGFFVMNKGINDPPIDTNLKIKEEQFSLFTKNLEIYNKYGQDKIYLDALIDEKRLTLETVENNCLDCISNTLNNFSHKKWSEIGEYELFEIFTKTYYIWDKKFSAIAGQDQDTSEPDKK